MKLWKIRSIYQEVLLKIWKTSVENACARFTFFNDAAKLKPATALKKRPRQMIFSVISKNFKNPYSEKLLRAPI